MQYSFKELGLVDSPPEAAFDNLTELATSLFNTPVSLISIIEFEKNRQYFKSQQGLTGKLAEERQTPLNYSYCQHVVMDNATLIVEDSAEHLIFKDYPAPADMKIGAYLGAPIYYPKKEPIGAFCIVESEARQWTKEEIEQLESLSNCVTDAISLKAAKLDSEALRMEQAEFTYAISHDLKSPVNTLQLLINELAIIPPSDEVEEHKLFIDRSLQTIDRMGGLIEDILGYTRACAQKRAPTEDVSLSQIVAGIIEDLAGEVSKCGGTINCGDLPTVQANPLQMRILFQNLICNALKFSRKGIPPIVTIDSEFTSDGYNHLIVVRDNGIGIAEEHQGKIFKVFARLHNESDYVGNGLGLALSHRIAANYGGKIEIDSTKGSGSRFSVFLPGEFM